MNNDCLKGLNPAQREAVSHIEGPLLALAGAGSGKTRVITHRIAHLIANRIVRADQILGVTFTNKAAGEMKERVINLLGPAGRFVWLSTFHSFCARQLRTHADKLGFKRDFTIYDTADSKALIKRIIKNLGIPENQPSPASALNAISRAKDKLISVSVFQESASDFIIQNTARIYDDYQKQLKKNSAMDFNDLLMLTVNLFDKFPDIRAFYQQKFPFLLVDEYQDTNYAQYRLIKFLAGERKNICVVGDDDQSIYGWRGADINNILNFELDYSGCKIVKLEQNYRSTKTILDSAYHVIRKNINRKSKRLFTDKLGGDNITFMLCGDDRDEAEAVTAKIQLGLRDDKSPSDFAILFRTHAQSRSIEDALRDAGVPYVIIGGTRFYERKEIKDIIAYLRLMVNPDDTESLLRIINVPKRKVGKVSIERLLKAAEQENISPFELLAKPDSAGIKGIAAVELKKLYQIITNLSKNIDKMPLDEIAARLIDDVGYLKMLTNDTSPEADVRADNVKEFQNAVISYIVRIKEDDSEDQQPSLSGFLEEIALITETDNRDENGEAATLMTLHAAKGLEFDTVFITGMEQGLFPLIRDSLKADDIEEERRLCYVGITRAMNRLFLTMASFRRRYGSINFTSPSCFLNDIPEELIDVERFNYYERTPALKYSPKQQPANSYKARTNKLIANNDNSVSTNSEKLSDYDKLRAGVRVSHFKFGDGMIINKEGKDEDTILTIRFGASIKKIMVKFAPLDVLDN
ncbi:MAG: UvrD-helicase domain-containing protein [candidate division Zixibacteria bacterium]|nr:UvrD-helicase domain-containing protein [candidate division Zixibacteria bacterium]